MQKSRPDYQAQPVASAHQASHQAEQQVAPQRGQPAASRRVGAAPNIDRDAALLRQAGRSAGVGSLARQMQRRFGNSYTAQAAAAARDMQEGSQPAPAAAPRKLKLQLQPHSGSEAALRSLAPIYQQGKTPLAQGNGQVTAVDLTPADAATTGRQIEQIQQQYGQQGLEQTVRGLSLTRGAAFTTEAIRQAPALQGRAITQALRAASLEPGNDDVLSTSAPTTTSRAQQATGERLSGDDARLLGPRSGGQAVPEEVRRRLAPFTSDSLDDVRIYNDSAANALAQRMGARAFALGRAIYFAAGEFDPSSERGQHLLAHEIAHTIQQRGAVLPAPHEVRIGGTADKAEHEAEHFAQHVMSGTTQLAPFHLASHLYVARVQRVISFARTNDTITTNTMGVGETAAGFQVRPNAFPLFDWWADVTINGAAGDPFADFEVGPHQVVRSFQANFHWGSGADHTHRRLSCTAFPVRDATATGNTWYHDAFARAFSANGETQNTGLRDSPQSSVQPWANPVAGRGGTRGYFNYGAAFVAYISARDTTRGTGAAAFRALGALYWNIPLGGTFDTTQAVGSRVSITTGGTVNRGRVIEGGSGEFPSMHGGTTGNTTFVVTTT